MYRQLRRWVCYRPDLVSPCSIRQASVASSDVCRIHHRELHRSGDEAAWWQKLNIDPLPVALKLWQHTRLNNDEFGPSTGIRPSQAAQKSDGSP
jgi:hypothetical protein